MNRTYYSIKIEHLIEKLRENLVGWRIIPPSNIKEGSIRLITPESLGFYLFPGERLWELIPVLSSSLRRVRIGPWSLSSVLDAREVGRDIPWKIKTIQSLVEYLKTEEFRSLVVLKYLTSQGILNIGLQNIDSWGSNPVLRGALLKYNPSEDSNEIKFIKEMNLIAKDLLLGKKISDSEGKQFYNRLKSLPVDIITKTRWLSLLISQSAQG